MNNNLSLLDIIDKHFNVNPEYSAEASKELKKIKTGIAALEPATANNKKQTQKKIESDKKELNIFRLFGTSGIRGIVKNIYADVVREYADKTLMSPKLAYYYGRAYGVMTRTRQKTKKIRLNMDPRPSSITMATMVCEGLIDEGIEVMFNGVAATPMASLYPNGIVITASHNELRYNGIKAFIDGIPITFDMEWSIESGFRLLDRLEKEGKTIVRTEERGTIFYAVEETHSTYIQLGQRILKEEHLVTFKQGRNSVTPPLSNTVMPLDLAFGAAGAIIEKDTNTQIISPQLRLLLHTGTIIVGYGTEQDGKKTNYRIGAAYPYGETPDTIGEGELAAFAQGAYGYGDDKKGGHISRSIYFPEEYTFTDPSLAQQALQADGAHLFLNIDNPENSATLAQLKKEIRNYTLLPACSVDCDEDRFLTTSVYQVTQPIPYLSGDLMVMLFANNLKKQIKKVVFTIESGLSIGKYLKKNNIDYEEVTVGDRAIADYIMDHDRLTDVPRKERHKIMGGEPSGHMMFGAIEQGSMVLIDDPIITQLKILGLMKATGKNFDDLIKEITGEVEEVYTARKPEAWAGKPNGTGISLSEKIQLELRERGNDRLFLTPYAKQFIPAYIHIFAEGYRETYYDHILENNSIFPETQTTVILSEEYTNTVKEGAIITGLIDYLPVGQIDISTNKGKIVEKVTIKLRLTNKDWAGTADINLSFYAQNPDKKLRLAGGVASRNSGTSPKNSAYNKLWFEHYPTGRRVGNDVIESVTTAMAEKRVDFTNRFIEKLRLQE